MPYLRDTLFTSLTTALIEAEQGETAAAVDIFDSLRDNLEILTPVLAQELGWDVPKIVRWASVVHQAANTDYSTTPWIVAFIVPHVQGHLN